MSDEKINAADLTYLISEKGALIVVSLVGTLNKKGGEALEKCQAELAAKSVQYVILNLHDVTELQLPGVAALVRLQKAVRDQKAQLRLCFIKPEFRKLLEERGAIRGNEITDSLLDALKSLGLMARSD